MVCIQYKCDEMKIGNIFMTVIKLFNIFCSIEVENIVADIRDLGGWGWSVL